MTAIGSTCGLLTQPRLILGKVFTRVGVVSPMSHWFYRDKPFDVLCALSSAAGIVAGVLAVSASPLTVGMI
jgi:hypothetical protein